MPLIFQLLLLITGFGGFNGVRDETMCTLNACYTVYMEKVSFDKANQRCFHNGGYLMTLRNKEEEEILHSLLLLIQKNNSQQFWIGLKLHRGDCVLADKPLRGFKWVSGEADSQYSNWNKDPVDTCTERCVRVSYNSPDEDQLTWTAGACKGPLFSVCKFYFKGMCSALHLLGSGYISYMAPFSEDPLESEMKSLPLGTYAKVSCTDQQEHFSVCIQKNEIYQWTVPGPFCQPENVKCAQNNGGCEHICQQDSDQVKCICNQGYDLEDNGLSCKIQDVCTSDTCEYECIVGELEHICICPIGFELDANLHNCSDIDECQESDACSTHFCINTAGSYMCACRDGFRMNQGNCHDLDECVHSKCSQSCLNTIGSFSCCCEKGFTLSEDGYSCEDINECATVRCPLKCINTEGSFICGCPEGFHVHSTGTKCTPDVTDARGYESVGQETPGNITETVPMTTGEPQTISTPKDMPVPLTPSNTSLYASAKVVNSRVLICVLGSVIPLLLLVTVTLTIAVVRCRRLRKEAKKSATDSYCWVSSGFNPRLEKLYESILTDDL